MTRPYEIVRPSLNRFQVGRHQLAQPWHDFIRQRSEEPLLVSSWPMEYEVVEAEIGVTEGPQRDP